MSLRWYRRPRLVVLNPKDPVLDAARAIERTGQIQKVRNQLPGDLRGIFPDV